MTGGFGPALTRHELRVVVSGRLDGVHLGHRDADGLVVPDELPDQDSGRGTRRSRSHMTGGVMSRCRSPAPGRAPDTASICATTPGWLAELEMSRVSESQVEGNFSPPIMALLAWADSSLGTENFPMVRPLGCRAWPVGGYGVAGVRCGRRASWGVGGAQEESGRVRESPA